MSRRISWGEWIWLQLAIPACAAVVATGVIAIPFAFIWPPMTKASAWFVLLCGLAYGVYCVRAQARAIKRDGLSVPYK